MKNGGIFFSLLIIFFALLFLNAISSGVTGKNTGNVDDVNGVLVFYRSSPVTDFETMGTVKVGLTMSNKPEELIDVLTSKLKKQFPTAEAIVISDPNMNSGSAIKFK